ncbi:DUF6146 family protein [Lacinutrix chionoecetis]
MKNLFILLAILVITFSCNSSKEVKKPDNENTQLKAGDTIKISSEELEYDVIIIEPGFGTYLASIAHPEGFYTQEYMESRNIRYVQEWNRRVQQPGRYNPNLYELDINYRHGIDYGYEVNYKIYNYFVYFQNKYNQNLLGGRVPQN